MGEEFKRTYAEKVCPVSLDADRVLEKPLDARTLRTTVSAVLALSRQPSAVNRQPEE